MATDATRAPGVCLLQHPGEVACLVRPAVGLPQRAPPQVLVGVDQRAPAVEGPLPDLLAGDRVRGRRLIAGCAVTRWSGRRGGRGSWPGGPGGTEGIRCAGGARRGLPTSRRTG